MTPGATRLRGAQDTESCVISSPANSLGRVPALFVSRYAQRWHKLFLKKFEGAFAIETIYLTNIVRKKGFTGVADHVNAVLRERDIGLAFLDVEFYFGFGIDLLEALSQEVRFVLTVFDDNMIHHVNYINAMACDLVLCTDPIGVMKYREKGLPAELCFLENSREPFDQYAGTTKDIDVLFFGKLTKGGRKEFLSKIAGLGVAVTVHDPELDGVRPYNDLVKLIARAKIVLNFSQTQDHTDLPETVVPFERAFQLKGRVLQAGLAKAACVSEYAPAIEFLFGTEVVPMFRTAEECVQILKGLLANEARRAELADRLHSQIVQRFEETVEVPYLIKTIKELPPRKVRRRVRVPYYYVSAVAKARFLRGWRPVAAWIRDLFVFVFQAKPYAWSHRWLAILEVCMRAPSTVLEFKDLWETRKAFLRKAEAEQLLGKEKRDIANQT